MDGVLIIDKPSGLTSHDVVKRVRKRTGVRKVGHTGTLDPLATGVLVVSIGKATRLIRFMPDDKEYRAGMVLGVTTSTQDASGEILSRADGVGISRGELEEALKGFVGEIEQTPPMTSALHHKGERLYRLARRGIWVERKPRRTFIDSIDLISFDPPKATLLVSCSKGTYIRTLCADIGEALGCGAHLSELRRTRVGRFTTADSVALDELSPDSIRRYLISIDDVFNALPEAVVKDEALKRVSNGLPARAEDLQSFPEWAEAGDIVKIRSSEGRLVAIAKASEGEDRLLRMLRVLY